MVKTRAQHRKQRIAELWAKVESSQNLFYDILSRVPVESIRKFKTVNKYWHRSISNKYFAKQQIMQSRKDTSFMVCPVRKSSMTYSSVNLYLVEVGSFEISYLDTIYSSQINVRSMLSSLNLISSFNGLICSMTPIPDEDIQSEFCHRQIWIWNPCTGDRLLLPQGRPSFQFEPTVGVAYGSDISDYRVFRIFSTEKKNPEERVRRFPYSLTYECEVYSSSSGAWKYIGPVPMSSRFTLHKKFHVFLGGKIYWLVCVYDPGEILSVDLEGRFEVIKLPKYEDKIAGATHLFILQGCLALFVMHADNIDIWIWKAKGEKYSWVREYYTKMPFGDFVFTVSSIKNKILCVTYTHWCTYDVDTKIWSMKRGTYNLFINNPVLPFHESLMPCNGGVRL